MPSPMKTAAASVSRRRVLASTATLASTLAVSSVAGAATGDQESADFLFVQTANEMTFDTASKKLTLTNVSPVTLFFSDRPERIAGNMQTAAFVPFWSEGKNSFLSDPPNADISILEDGALRQTVAVLHDPVLEGDALVYTVEVIDGEMPATGQDVSVFIDIIGMPMTPVSMAGVGRRSFRRAAMY